MRDTPMKGSTADKDEGQATGRIEKSVVIPNPEGFHIRAIRPFVELASKFEAEISVSVSGRERNGKSVIDLMQLAAGQGAELLISAEGDDAEEALKALEDLVNKGFYER